jgi:hypothetical protein
MNCQTMEQLWDPMRDRMNALQISDQANQSADQPDADGADLEITPDQQQAFEDHLNSCGRCQNLWQAETDWLSMVAQPDQAADSTLFTDRVIESWQQPENSVLASIGSSNRSSAQIAIRIGFAIAAACVLMVSGWFMFRPIENPIGPDAPVVIEDQIPFTPSIESPDTLDTSTTSSVASLVGTVSQYTDGPAMIQEGIQSTRLALNFDQALALLGQEVSVPDPAQYVQP